MKHASSDEENIRTTPPHQLDSEMKDILQRSSLSDYKKAKLYKGVLQRYLVLAKHGEMEKTKINLFLPEEEQKEIQPPEVQWGSSDFVIREVLEGVNPRYKKKS